jgi:hypothetical protein
MLVVSKLTINDSILLPTNYQLPTTNYFLTFRVQNNPDFCREKILFMPWFLLVGFWMMVSPAPVKPSDKSFHPFYISVTEINHNAKDKILEISCKMFAEDLESQLEKNYKTTLDISSEKDKASFDKFIPDYISQHFSLAVDGKPVKLVYVGFEKEKESAYCNFQVSGVPSLKIIDILK